MSFPCLCHQRNRECLYLTALVPNQQLAEAEKKDKAGTCSVLLSLLEITATRVALVPYAVPARQPTASLHVSLWSLWSLYSVSSSVTPSSALQAYFLVGSGHLDGNPARNAVPSHPVEILAIEELSQMCTCSRSIIYSHWALTQVLHKEILQRFIILPPLWAGCLKLNQFTALHEWLFRLFSEKGQIIYHGVAKSSQILFRVVHCF